MPHPGLHMLYIPAAMLPNTYSDELKPEVHTEPDTGMFIGVCLCLLGINQDALWQVNDSYTVALPDMGVLLTTREKQVIKAGKEMKNHQ